MTDSWASALPVIRKRRPGPTGDTAGAGPLLGRAQLRMKRDQAREGVRSASFGVGTRAREPPRSRLGAPTRTTLHARVAPVRLVRGRTTLDKCPAGGGTAA